MYWGLLDATNSNIKSPHCAALFSSTGGAVIVTETLGVPNFM